MHTVFRIHDIKPWDENQRLFQVDLTLTGENDDKDLRILTDRIREETYQASRGWYQIGFGCCLKWVQFQKAEQVYEVHA